MEIAGGLLILVLLIVAWAIISRASARGARNAAITSRLARYAGRYRSPR